ncbi:hypothetical protein [Chelatococcus composti]|jgi:hypothetical protein|uniref:Uncharacterized protein n=1 Tax=Chelatococcus composti TaxID=1743235 RepID=A0A841KI77_9HYPH|nr:hypothetical protein [Chelatococcus composti]MBB6169636.1 hypothetical protein [Chelatococcus composti]MBS7736835.1 hypothetical protein [Chelatococcus composti]PZN41213.1 MAG: hypothetical protein DIU59_09825 [Pseudomonadota bacterium]GGG49515.1 hypothetical protein GCM10008026_33370 [Chelatococcus composti]
MIKSRKVWVGLGAAVLVGTGIGTEATAQPLTRGIEQAAPGDASARQDLVLRVAGSHAGHAAAGEGEGEGGGAELAPDLRLTRDLALISGHLAVGNELVEAGRWSEATVHFLHPAEELYGDIAGDLKSFGIPPFSAALKALAQTVKAKKKDAYEGALKTVRERLAAADAAVKAKTADWPGLTLEAVLEVLNTAGEEYEAAIENGKFKLVVEYQDSRGFVLQAEKMLAAVAPDLEKKNAEAYAALQHEIAELKKAWPSVTAPKKPVLDVSQVLGHIARAEIEIGKLM